ncbi:MAG: T9SS type A sorting domain-containing protein [Bacteroidetes bacterium]|nr:T9SS type A sorting domain-containing protein [Bacteroidota bacterium]
MKKIYVLLLFSILGVKTFATHIKAGEITYTHLTGLIYKINVNIYTNTDPLTTQADRCNLIIYFGDGDSTMIPRINGPSLLCTTADGEMFATYSKKNIYETTHTYSGNGLYIITMEDPNREAGICNIPNSVDQSFFIRTTLLISSSITTNNSAQFTSIPVFYAAVNVPYTQNITAHDSDGDILTYELIPCMGNGSPIMGYTYPTGFSIDSLSGEISWNTPSMICKYNFAVKVRKWRNGATIGEVIREFQICTVAYTGTYASSKKEEKISLYPNPVSDKIFISKINNGRGNTLLIYGLTGILIKNVYLSENSSEVEVSELTRGFYNYEILSDKTSIARGKFVKN